MPVTNIPPELTGKTPDELREIVEYLDANIKAVYYTDLGEIRSLDQDEADAIESATELRNKAVDMIDDHKRMREVFDRRPQAVEAARFNIHSRPDDAYGDVRRLNNGEARDLALRSLDDRNATSHLATDQKDLLDKQIRSSDTTIARRILVTENDAYRSAWVKAVTRYNPRFTDEEARALDAFDEFRNMAESTNSGADGGYGIPVFIDPSIILTAQGSGNPFLSLARQVTVNTNKWKGVSSAGVTWSFDIEAREVSDDSATIAQPTVDVFMARGFIPYSIELGMDYPSFASEMATLLAAGYNELLADKFARGSGSNEPTGILTALSNTSSVVVPTTDGSFGGVDIFKVWEALPERYRMNASWMMSVNVNGKIRKFQDTTITYNQVDLRAEYSDVILGKPVYESSYFPDYVSTTGVASIAVVGDFNNFLIARNGGMSVELVPHMFGTTSNRPTGERGWFAYARIGSDSVNDNGFRLLQNT